MSDSALPSPTNESVERQAAAWVLRLDRGLAAAEQDAYTEWLAADPRHGTALARHRQNWDRLNLLGQWRPEHSPRPNRDLLAPSYRPERMSPTTLRRWTFGGLALAAAAALAIAVYVKLPTSATGVPVAPVAIATIEKRTLEDGSVVELNRGAKLAVNFSAGERRVSLERGEAHFTVTKNPERPFIVAASGIEVRAIGTAFNVRLGPQAVEVLVTEGRVGVGRNAPQSVTPAAQEPVRFVSVGQRLVVARADSAIPPASAVTSVSREEIDRALAWQPRLFDFSEEPLRGLVAAFNERNAPYHVVIADPALAEVQISATLRSDNVEGFLRLLEAGFDVRVERSGQTIVLRRK